ncbi:MAG: tRNA (N6-isopentenyl adenosine(37)-C2)-methylthiotransferase MiaB [Vicinamibacterales bacterium]
MARKYLIETYGCQMNVHDSERMAGLLEAAGFEPTDADEDADLVVINTCSVREKAEDKLYTRLGDLKGLRQRSGRAPMVAVTGCVAQQEGGQVLARSSLVDVVVGTQRARLLPMLVEEAAARRDAVPRAEALVDIATPYDEPTFPFGLTRRGDPVKGFVTIVEGCNDYCAYCVVPYTRGHERMRSKREILAEVAALAASGRREVQLLGQIVNHYQAPDDPACDFPALLEAVHGVDGIDRIRFASPHPRHCSARLIAALRDLPKVCKHLHLPVQSGSSSVLKAMRRRHTREEYLDLVGRLRDALPDIQLSTDMIVGFPGETVEDFEQTLSLTEAAQYHGMFSFKYSPRPNTLAAQRMADDVPEAEKTRRIVVLQQLQKDIQARLHAQTLGRTVEVLVDTTSRRRAWELAGRTSGNTVVNFPGEPEWLGQFVPVHIERTGAFGVWGQPVAASRRAGTVA